MINVSLSSDDVQRQIVVLQEFPELAEKHYRPVLNKDTNLLRGMIWPNIPYKTGQAMKTFGSKVSGKGFRLKGQVGWYDRSDPWYPNVLEYGAKPHRIRTTPQQVSFLYHLLGYYVGQTIEHPGLSARGFMAAGYSAIKPTVDQDIFLANERIIADLAVI